jgi:hypothetical protein
LIDVESDDHDALEQGTEKILNIVKNYNTEGFLADTEIKESFSGKTEKSWCHSRHTNAFKLMRILFILLRLYLSFLIL